jgi:general secretion pathway protein I
MRRSAAGFTLLEAIVALAILAAGTMALFAALNGAVRSIGRAEEAARLDTATENAIALLETINPMERPEGEERLGDMAVQWRAKAVEPPGPGLTDYLQPGLFDVGLYDVEVVLVLDGRVERRFAMRRAGWVQARQPEVL